MNKILERIMTHRVDIYGKKMMGLLASLLALTLGFSSCSSVADEQEGNDAWVTLTITTGGEGAMAKAGTASRADASSSSSTDKDNDVKDLTIYIFDQAGQVIGSSYDGNSIVSNNTITATIKTRKAQGCTVIAVANAGTLTGSYTTAATTSPFAGVSTLSDFQQKFITFKDSQTMEGAPCLLMMGKLENFDTTSSGKSISLQRLASRLDFTITVNQDKDTGFPIVVDSYQLCHAPLSAYYAPANLQNIILPSSATYVDYTTHTTGNAYTAYVYANPATTAANATYLLVKAHSQASSVDTRKIWESEFKVYLAGITGLTDYKLLPNYHYTIKITIQGSSKATNGVIATYDAYPYLDGSNLKDWEADNRNQDM